MCAHTHTRECDASEYSRRHRAALTPPSFRLPKRRRLQGKCSRTSHADTPPSVLFFFVSHAKISHTHKKLVLIAPSGVLDSRRRYRNTEHRRHGWWKGRGEHICIRVTLHLLRFIPNTEGANRTFCRLSVLLPILYQLSRNYFSYCNCIGTKSSNRTFRTT